MPDGSILNLTRILKPKKMFVAQSPALWGLFGLENIKISLLFDEFSYNEKVAILYHELWHRKNNEWTEIKMYIKPWLIFYHKPIYYCQEFSADIQGAKLGGKKNMLSVLKKLKNMIKQKKIDPSHKNTHPPIDERIKRIEMLKD